MLDVGDIDKGPNRGGGWRCFYKIKDREMCIGNHNFNCSPFMCKVKPSDCVITKIRTLRQELRIMCHVFCDAHVGGL